MSNQREKFMSIFNKVFNRETKSSNKKCRDHFNDVRKIYYVPSQIRKVYGFSKIDFDVSGDGVTVAVIIAYKNLTIQDDFNLFCDKFNLPKKELTVISLGNVINDQWSFECNIDVQMIHVAALHSKIIIVEAATESDDDFKIAIEVAISHGANIINMSWGGSEFNYHKEYDEIFKKNNISFVASSGDTAMVLDYPSSSPNVLSVGGTSLLIDKKNKRKEQICWSQSGSGFSKIFKVPHFQEFLGFNFRHSPDLCAIANPYAGVIICYNGKFYSVGGTSVSAPIVSGMLACANSLRLSQGKDFLTTNSSIETCIQNYLYLNLYKDNKIIFDEMFYDIKIGSNGSLNSKKGFDLCSGLGTFNADKLIHGLCSI